VVPRRASRSDHLAAGRPAESLGGQPEIERHTLRGLLDELEEIFPSDAQASHAGAVQ
jgi:hypothetical protein